MGEKGLKEVNEYAYAGAHYLYDKLLALDCFEKVYDQPFLNEFTLRYTGTLQTLDALRTALCRQGYLAGVKAEGSDNLLILAVTEQRTQAEIDAFVQCLEKAATHNHEEV